MSWWVVAVVDGGGGGSGGGGGAGGGSMVVVPAAGLVVVGRLMVAVGSVVRAGSCFLLKAWAGLLLACRRAPAPAAPSPQDFGGFRIVVLLPRFSLQWPPPGCRDGREVALKHPELAAPRPAVPILQSYARPIVAATFRLGPGFMEVPVYATQETRRTQGGWEGAAGSWRAGHDAPHNAIAAMHASRFSSQIRTLLPPLAPPQATGGRC